MADTNNNGNNSTNNTVAGNNGNGQTQVKLEYANLDANNSGQQLQQSQQQPQQQQQPQNSSQLNQQQLIQPQTSQTTPQTNQTNQTALNLSLNNPYASTNMNYNQNYSNNLLAQAYQTNPYGLYSATTANFSNAVNAASSQNYPNPLASLNNQVPTTNNNIVSSNSNQTQQNNLSINNNNSTTTVAPGTTNSIDGQKPDTTDKNQNLSPHLNNLSQVINEVKGGSGIHNILSKVSDRDDEDSEAAINRKKRRPYTKQQIQQLEQEYRLNTYIARERRLDLGKNLNLTDRQVKVWFQNRRMKEKRIIQRGAIVSLQDSELAAAVSLQNAQNNLLNCAQNPFGHLAAATGLGQNGFPGLQPFVNQNAAVTAATQLSNSLLAGNLGSAIKVGWFFYLESN